MPFFLLKDKFLLGFFLLLGAGLAISPFMRGTDSVQMALAIALPLLACGALLIPALRGSSLILPLNGVSVSLGLFWIYLTLALFWSSVPYISMIFTLLLGLIPLLFFTALFAPDRDGVARALTLILMFTGGGYLVSTLIQFVFFQDPLNARIEAPFLDPNNLAVFMNMMFGYTLATAFAIAQKKNRAAFLVLAGLFFLAVVATGSRTGILIALALGVLFLAYMIAQDRRFWRIGLGALALAGTALGLGAFLTGGLLTKSFHIFSSLATAGSVTDRLALWGSGARMLAEDPWGLRGLGNFYFYYPAFRQTIDQSDGYFLHMDPLQIGIEAGLPALVLLYTVLIAVMVRTARALCAPGTVLAARLAVIAPLLGLLALGLQMHITFCIYLPSLALMAAIMLCLWERAVAAILGPGRLLALVLPGRASWRLLVLALAVLLPSLWIARAAAGVHYVLVSERIAAGDIKKAQDAAARATLLAPRESYSPCEQAAGLILIEKPAAGKQRLREGMALTEECIARNPAYTGLHVLKAVFHARLGEMDKSEETFLYALRLNPLLINARYDLAAIYKGRGEFQKALAVLEEGMRWPRPKGVPDVEYIVTVAQLNKVLGNQARHEELVAWARKRIRDYRLDRPSQ